jgi:hypothetical protein
MKSLKDVKIVRIIIERRTEAMIYNYNKIFREIRNEYD